MIKVVRNVSFVFLVAMVLVAVQERARAFGSVQSNPNCFCNYDPVHDWLISCECPDYENCAVQYPDFCNDFAEDCGCLGVFYCDGGSGSMPCMGTCWPGPCAG